MAYALQPLLRIRVMREDRASGELTAARQAVAVAEAALEDRKRELVDYERTKEERRDRIYATIIGRAVSRDSLDLAQDGVARIDDEGILKADNVKRAEVVLNEKMSLADTARRNLNIATKNRMKIEEHRAVWIAADIAEQEHRAEGELEDFMVRKPEI